MNIDETLRRFRPAGPPAGLREKVLACAATEARGRRVDRLLVAVAALVVTAGVALNHQAEHELARYAPEPPAALVSGRAALTDGVVLVVRTRVTRIARTSALHLRNSWITEGP